MANDAVDLNKGVNVDEMPIFNEMGFTVKAEAPEVPQKKESPKESPEIQERVPPPERPDSPAVEQKSSDLEEHKSVSYIYIYYIYTGIYTPYIIIYNVYV